MNNEQAKAEAEKIIQPHEESIDYIRCDKCGGMVVSGIFDYTGQQIKITHADDCNQS